MHYTGETLMPGLLGHFFIILSLVASLVASFAYFKAVQSKPMDADQWKKLARGAFFIEALSVFSVFAILFYIISNHLFEYKYAWQHSSRSLEVKYLLSCFWEGQEGSFLLWSIWHCVLGLILIRTAKQWEAPVMSVISFAQFCLATMIVGLFFFDHKVGSNPFVLLRNEGLFDGAPAFHDATGALRADYLTLVKDGNDLNPLLQNYWMVIHPPVLFMGFASTIVPFAFAIGGLWTRKYGEWIKPALPWALFSAAVLGTGIMMGGAWAYESLNFGGYWAWDPVENASLVPWLVLISGIHTLLIYKHTGRSLKATLIFFILSFLLVLYSTFLTRSGILGDTSVHAFTDLGMNVQLFSLFYVFVWLGALAAANNKKAKLYTGIAAVAAFAITYFAPVMAVFSILGGVAVTGIFINESIPSAFKEEEKTSSREFWMFIASLVFFLAAFFIIVATSLPVINKFFHTKATMGADSVHSYNRVIIFIAIIVALLTAITQYFRYKQTDTKSFKKKIVVPTIISAVIATLVIAFGNINYQEHGMGFLSAIWLAVACSIYAVIANAAYIWIGMKGKLNLSGGSIAHLGFGILLTGILISSSKKEILSYNTSGIYVPLGEGSKEKAGENITLIKNVPTRMNNYVVTYTEESKHPKKELWYYKLKFQNEEGKELFTLSPNAFVNYKGNGGLMANPDAKHYWNHDVFTYISSLANPDAKDTSTFRPRQMKPGDTAFYSNGYFLFDTLETKDHVPTGGMAPDDKLYIANLKVYSKKKDTMYTSRPVLVSKGGNTFPIRDSITEENLYFELNAVNGNNIDLGVRESDAILNYVTLKAYNFPFINLVWLGTIVMVVGIIISMGRRIRLNRTAELADKL